MTICELRRGAQPKVAAVLAIVAIGLAAGGARAQSQAQRQRAVDLLREGNRLFEAGDYQGALARYQDAYALVPSPKVFFNVGQTQRALGRFVEGLESYERFLTEAKDASPALRLEAARRRAELDQATATIEVSAERNGSAIAGAPVFIDGRPCGETPLVRPVHVMPGLHTVVVQARGGAASVVTSVEVAAGTRGTVRAALPAPPGPAKESLAPSMTGTPAAGKVPGGSGEGAAVPVAAVSDRAASPPNSPSRFGVMVRADLDWKLAGAGAAAAFMFAVSRRVEIDAGSFVWPAGGRPVAGASLGGTLHLSRGRVRPLVAADAQLYFSGGVHPAARAALGLAFDLNQRVALILTGGVEHAFGSLPNGAPRTFPVPALGLTGRL